MNWRLPVLFALAWSLCQPVRAQQASEPVEVKIDAMESTPVGVSITLRAVNVPGNIHMMIGFPEGQSIARALRHQKPPRPMTHDLLQTFLDRNGWHVQKVLIRELAGGTYLADLILERAHETQVYDARPSDAMALGLRYDAKIYVNPDVFEEEKKREEEPGTVKPSEPETLRL